MLRHQETLRGFYQGGYPAALLWDLDGVLADTMMTHFQALRETVEADGLFFPESIIGEGTGRTDRENLSSILRTNGRPLDEEKIEDLLAAKAVRFKQIVRSGLQPTPGVLDWLTAASNLSIPCAVASSAKPEVIAELLDILEIAHFFPVLISGDNLPRSKPAPEIFLRAAEALGVRPEVCLVIEDALVGIQAAHAAGMRCIAIGTSYPLEELAQGDIVVKDLTEVSLI